MRVDARRTLGRLWVVLGIGDLLLLGVGLAMDATAVSAARGLAAERVGLREMSVVAVMFGGSQAMMPLIGWALGSAIGEHLAAFDHWIAFLVLAGFGVKMLHEAFAEDDDDDERPASGDPFAFGVMFVLAVATSLDALAVGVTLPLVDAPLLLSVTTIGVTTALLSVLGLHAGRRFGALLGKKLDALGGLALIAVGTKILVEHL